MPDGDKTTGISFDGLVEVPITAFAAELDPSVTTSGTDQLCCRPCLAVPALRAPAPNWPSIPLATWRSPALPIPGTSRLPRPRSNPPTKATGKDATNAFLTVLDPADTSSAMMAEPRHPRRRRARRLHRLLASRLHLRRSQLRRPAVRPLSRPVRWSFRGGTWRSADRRALRNPEPERKTESGRQRRSTARTLWHHCGRRVQPRFTILVGCDSSTMPHTGAFIPTVSLPQRDIPYSARTAGRLSCARNCAAPKRR